jgi:hypothetical protein
MKFVFPQMAHPSRLFVAIAVCIAAFPVSSQTPSAPSPDQTPKPQGQVIFSRSTDDNGQTTTTAGPAAQALAGQMVAAPIATDAEREAITFTAFDMDVHLRSVDHQIAVRALLTVRNDSKSPLAHVPLQISSSLNWERIRVGGRDIAYTVATLNSDVDHTGQLHEAAIPLPTPLAPGATLQFDVTYSGAIEQSAQRLLAIGTPDDVALHSDWDSIGVNFTGLRGFGNVVWYPASSVPAVLGMSQEASTLHWQAAGPANVDSARIFEEMGEHKLRMSGARFRLRLAVEFPRGQAPTIALINGHPAVLSVTEPDAPSSDVPGVATASFESAVLGFEAPSLFVAVRTPKRVINTKLWILPANAPAVQGWASAAETVSPFLQGWLGQQSRSQLTILDLPDPLDTPAMTGPLLVTAVRQATPEQLDGVLAHALAQVWLDSPRAWLNEGVADFMGSLWIEKQNGRQKALESLESSRAPLALAEPSSPGESPGQPLAQAISPAYYRIKASYVLWMLRDLIGDPDLSAAFIAYSPTEDAKHGLGSESDSAYFEKLATHSAAPSDGSPSPGSGSGQRRDLSWFFSDWIDSDKGLPDIAIDSVYPGPTEGGSWLVAVNLSNSGYAAAEIPVTVRNADTSVTRRIVVPARGKAVQRILIEGKPTEVQANDGTVPETEASIHIKTLNDSSGTSSSSQPALPAR